MTLSYGELFSTYSIVARDPETGQLGCAVQTHQMCVGRIVPWLLPGVGSVATQSRSNVSFGPMALAMLREGVAAPRVIDGLVATGPDAHHRQVAVVDTQGRAAAWTGTKCLAAAGHHVGQGYSVQANMTIDTTVISAMAAAYQLASGDLAARMMAALVAAQDEGGDIRGMQSAALKVVSGDATAPSWASDYDLRVDEHADPVSELGRLVRLRRAQLMGGWGDRAFSEGRRDEALALWAEARAEAPELEELAVWQARTLADEGADIAAAAEILRPVLAHDPRREHWIEMLRRLEGSGFVQRKGSMDELVAGLD